MLLTWSIVNNEIDYLKYSLDYHLSWVDKMYFLDTGSTDGTLELLQSKAGDKLVVEKYHISYKPDYSKDWHDMEQPFNEVEVRNAAIEGALKLKPTWLIQLDGDELFLPKTRQVIENLKDFDVISHSTINPVCPLEEHPFERRKGKVLYDPHARIWKANQAIRFAHNPAFQGKSFHCIPIWQDAPGKDKHVYYHPKNIFTDDIIMFHLHWCFGKKVDAYFDKKNIKDRTEISKTQKLNKYSIFLPQIFWEARKKWINYD